MKEQIICLYFIFIMKEYRLEKKSPATELFQAGLEIL